MWEYLCSRKFLDVKLDDNHMNHAGRETHRWIDEPAGSKFIPIRASSRPVIAQSCSKNRMKSTQSLSLSLSHTHAHTHTHTHTHTQSIPVGIFTAAISACQDLHHQVPETPKASETLQRDERFTDKSENILNHQQTQNKKWRMVYGLWNYCFPNTI